MGSIEVVGDEPIAIVRRRERLLFAVLLLEQGHSVTTDRLIDLPWEGETPANAAPALRSHISRPRALLPGVTTRRPVTTTPPTNTTGRREPSTSRWTSRTGAASPNTLWSRSPLTEQQ
ncbi:MAG TPA: hypothetical protein VM677_02395 [Actinokineospora sp.]|nr:hypothetical protein [Actinokineospora sp.]